MGATEKIFFKLKKQHQILSGQEGSPCIYDEIACDLLGIICVLQSISNEIIKT
jgi:hypothetical protein